MSIKKIYRSQLFLISKKLTYNLKLLIVGTFCMWQIFNLGQIVDCILFYGYFNFRPQFWLFIAQRVITFGLLIAMVKSNTFWAPDALIIIKTFFLIDIFLLLKSRNGVFSRNYREKLVTWKKSTFSHFSTELCTEVWFFWLFCTLEHLTWWIGTNCDFNKAFCRFK